MDDKKIIVSFTMDMPKNISEKNILKWLRSEVGIFPTSLKHSDLEFADISGFNPCELKIKIKE